MDDTDLQQAERELEEARERAMAEVSPPIRHVLQFFTFAHLKPPLRAVSALFTSSAIAVATGSSNPETTVALRKLLEAKDSAVRAALVG